MSHCRDLLEKQGLTRDSIVLFQKLIYDYYRTNGRDLPWRKTNNPYRILVSEIMLQQTQVDRVVKKYHEFIDTFPDFTSLAHASLRRILKVWQGMGYNRRALALKKIAQTVIKQFKGKLSSDIDVLARLPGIGRATASAIAAFAFNNPAIFVETNIRTVFLYFFFKNRRGVKDTDILPLVEKTMDGSNPRIWYHALMDFGTMLKKSCPNISRQSAHYTKQGPFEGSDRQIRGMILRALNESTFLSEAKIIKIVSKKSTRVKRILAQLHAEQLICKKGKTYTIA
ncbi:MAG: A/G-specific adenine glycosylase [candidate division WOR-3 bacterium]|nr:MAG: A/G-specific adenine glycosylase [candidate division WOR-3 bacterium]